MDGLTVYLDLNSLSFYILCLNVAQLTLSCPLSPQGGIAFVLIKGVLKVYFKQQQYIIQANRHILNYPERNGDEPTEGGEEDTEDSGNE